MWINSGENLLVKIIGISPHFEGVYMKGVMGGGTKSWGACVGISWGVLAKLYNAFVFGEQGFGVKIVGKKLSLLFTGYNNNNKDNSL